MQRCAHVIKPFRMALLIHSRALAQQGPGTTPQKLQRHETPRTLQLKHPASRRQQGLTHILNQMLKRYHPPNSRPRYSVSEVLDFCTSAAADLTFLDAACVTKDHL